MVRAGEISSVLIRGRRLFRIRDLDELYPLPLHSRLQISWDAATMPTARPHSPDCVPFLAQPVTEKL